MKGAIAMVEMFFFTLITNLVGWGAFLGTDYLLGDSSILTTVTMLEWLLIPLGFVAIYHYFIKGEYAKPGHIGRYVVWSLIMWLAMGTGIAAGAMYLIKNDKLLFKPVVSEMDIMMFATALVVGFAVIVAMIEFAWYMLNKPEKKRAVYR